MVMHVNKPRNSEREAFAPSARVFTDHCNVYQKALYSSKIVFLRFEERCCIDNVLLICSSVSSQLLADILAT